MSAIASRLARIEQTFGTSTRDERRAAVARACAGSEYDHVRERVIAAALGRGLGLFDVPADLTEDGQDATWEVLWVPDIPPRVLIHTSWWGSAGWR